MHDKHLHMNFLAPFFFFFFFFLLFFDGIHKIVTAQVRFSWYILGFWLIDCCVHDADIRRRINVTNMKTKTNSYKTGRVANMATTSRVKSTNRKASKASRKYKAIISLAHTLPVLTAKIDHWRRRATYLSGWERRGRSFAKLNWTKREIDEFTE